MDRRNKLIILASVVGLFAFIVFVYRDVIFRPRPAYERHMGAGIPDPVLKDMDSREIKLSELIKKTGPESKVILSMWATWCEPCTHELPLIKKSIPDLQKAGIQVHLINYDGPMPDKSIPEVKAWLISQKLDLMTYFDFGEEMTKALDVNALPFTVGIKDGKFKWAEVGELDWNQREALISGFN